MYTIEESIEGILSTILNLRMILVFVRRSRQVLALDSLLKLQRQRYSSEASVDMTTALKLIPLTYLIGHPNLRNAPFLWSCFPHLQKITGANNVV